MSGGHFNYAGNKIFNGLEDIYNDDEVERVWPITCALLSELGGKLSDIEADMDYFISGDTVSVPDDEEMVGKLLDVVLKACPDDWFPKGKWATIQAFQARSGIDS